MIFSKDYISKKKENARNLLSLKFNGLKRFYSYKDALDILKEFGFYFEIDLDEAEDFCFKNTCDISSIEAFSKGFIKSPYKMVALRKDKHFYLFAFGLKNDFIISYYTNIIDDFSVEICYILEEMINSN